jgi:hypothetical protein
MSNSLSDRAAPGVLISRHEEVVMRLTGLALALGLAAAWTVPQDKEKLKTTLRDTEVKGDWVYDDVDAGFALAKSAGKPVLLTFR